MKNELNVKIGNREIKCILLDGFYAGSDPTVNLHRHNYAEIHILCGKAATLELENEALTFSGCNSFAIPAGALHRFSGMDDGVLHSAFLIEAELPEFSQKAIPETLALDFFEETKKCEVSNDYNKIAAYISLFCCDLSALEPLCATPITDIAFIINNFLSVNYANESSLSELAAELHYSEKQTARLVKKYTGKTFRQAMIDYRMSIASHLAKNTDMPLSEIAERVGYNSYNGFWQVYRQYQK